MIPCAEAVSLMADAPTSVAKLSAYVNTRLSALSTTSFAGVATISEGWGDHVGASLRPSSSFMPANFIGVVFRFSNPKAPLPDLVHLNLSHTRLQLLRTVVTCSSITVTLDVKLKPQFPILRAVVRFCSVQNASAEIVYSFPASRSRLK